MARTLNSDGCEFGRLLRNDFEHFTTDIKEFRDEVQSGFKEIKEQNSELFNHQSTRWPPGAVWAMGIITAVAGGLAYAFISKMFGF